MPAFLAPDQLRENCESCVPRPSLTRMIAKLMPFALTRFQSIAPWWCETSTPRAQLAFGAASASRNATGASTAPTRARTLNEDFMVKLLFPGETSVTLASRVLGEDPVRVGLA